MTINILVATPQTSFGELLRFSLEESSKYRVRLAQSGREAMAAAGRINFDLAILDAALTDQPFPTLIHSLVETTPSMRLVVIPPENDPSRLSLNGVRPDAYLNLPFYAPDLFELVSKLVTGPSGDDQVTPISVGTRLTPSFQKNNTQLAASLAFQLVQTTAQAALVICRRELLASTGHLGIKQLQEIADILNHCWDENDPTDLSRYARLSGGGGEFKIYATCLAGGTFLALVYDQAAPLTRMRSQAAKAAQALRILPDEDGPLAVPVLKEVTEQTPAVASLSIDEDPAIPEIFTQSISEEAAINELDDLLLTTPPTGPEAADLLLALENDTKPNSTQLPAAESLAIDTNIPESRDLNEPDDGFAEMSSEDGEMPEVSLSDLLAAMPPPDPSKHQQAPGVEWISGDNENEPTGDFLFPWEKEEPVHPPIPLSIEDTQVPQVTAPKTSAQTPENQVNETALPTVPAVMLKKPDPTPSEGVTEKIIRPVSRSIPEQTTSPLKIQPGALTQQTAAPAGQTAAANPMPWNQSQEPENPSAEFASLCYTCVMLPRLPDFQINGSLALKLEEWLPNICLAYGWRLIGQSIRTDTFQWTIQVSATVSPGSIVRVVRMQTSRHIFEQFNRFAAVIPSGDFWAPGYLIISGSQPPDSSLVGEYIHQTRKRQGASR